MTGKIKNKVQQLKHNRYMYVTILFDTKKKKNRRSSIHYSANEWR